MHMRFSRPVSAILLLLGMLWLSMAVHSQEPPPAPQPQAAGGDLPPTPNGVEVQSRGPIHEAFATPTTEPVPTKPVEKAPPKAIDEMPPAEKPEGNAIWIAGYWAWDDDRKDYLWVSGTWRTPPPGKQWMAGYWKEGSGQYRWVPGFWTAANPQGDSNHQVTYMPAPPETPNVSSPGEPPTPESFYVPGQWVWHDGGYVAINGAQVYRDAGYSWTAGYWARVQPGYLWVAAHYRWTPSGYVFIPGYWDLAIARRGFLYAPVYVDAAIVGPTFVYTPAYAVPHTVIVDAFWVRPCYCHYYFGDYYGSVYESYGFESCVVYSRRHYEPIFVYAVYEHRAEPRWASVQVEICAGRREGRYACPPRTVVESVRVGYRGPGLVASARIGEVSGVRTARLEHHERMDAVHHAEAVRHVAMERNLHEVHAVGGAPRTPQTQAYHAPAAATVTQTHVPVAHAPNGMKGPNLPHPPGSVPPPARGVVPTNTKRPPVIPTNTRRPPDNRRPEPHDRKEK